MVPLSVSRDGVKDGTPLYPGDFVGEANMMGLTDIWTGSTVEATSTVIAKVRREPGLQ